VRVACEPHPPLRIAIRYALCMAQFVTRLEDALAERIDTLVAAGVFESR
jgi:hypothetical protein